MCRRIGSTLPRPLQKFSRRPVCKPILSAYDSSNQPTGMSGSGFSAAYAYDGNLKRVKSVEGGETNAPAGAFYGYV